MFASRKVEVEQFDAEVKEWGRLQLATTAAKTSTFISCTCSIKHQTTPKIQLIPVDFRSDKIDDRNRYSLYPESGRVRSRSRG